MSYDRGEIADCLLFFNPWKWEGRKNERMGRPFRRCLHGARGHGHFKFRHKLRSYQKGKLVFHVTSDGRTVGNSVGGRSVHPSEIGVVGKKEGNFWAMRKRTKSPPAPARFDFSSFAGISECINPEVAPRHLAFRASASV